MTHELKIKEHNKTRMVTTMVINERDFLNFMKLSPDWEITNEGYPIVKGLKLKSEPELVEFHEAHRVHKNLRKNKIVSFFLPDYLFERC